MICKLLMDPACAIRLSRRKVLFSDLKFLNMTPLNNDSRKVLHFSNLTVLKSHKERTAKFAPPPPPPPPYFKRGGLRPPHFKSCSSGPALQSRRTYNCSLQTSLYKFGNNLAYRVIMRNSTQLHSFWHAY